MEASKTKCKPSTNHAKKHFNIPQSLHTISKSIGPLLFKQDDIHSIFKVTKDLSINSPKSQYIEGYLF